MAISLLFMPRDQNSAGSTNEHMRNTDLANRSREIWTEQLFKRGRNPESMTNQPIQKKQRLRGLGIAEMERIIEERERNKSAITNPNPTRLPFVLDPVVFLQGFPSYNGGFNCGGHIMIDQVCSPRSVFATSNSEISSFRNPQVFKDNLLDGDNNVIRSNVGGYTMVPPPVNGYDHLLRPDPRSQSFFCDLNEATNHTGLMEKFGIENPRNGTGGVKEYDFFPGKTVSVSTSLPDDGSPNTCTIDLTLKL